MGIYRGSVGDVLEEIYPQVKEGKLRRGKMPKGYWRSMEKQRLCLDEMGHVLDICTQRDWAHVKNNSVVSAGGSGILWVYNGGVLEMLETIYEEFSWKMLERKQIPRKSWNSQKFLRKIAHVLCEEFLLKNHTDWYRLSNNQVLQITGRKISKKVLIKMNLMESNITMN